MDKVKINKFLFKLANFSGYVLAVLMLLYFISGYGMTKQIVDPIFATILHDKWLPLPTAIAFLLHTLIYTKFALQRKIKNEKWVNIYTLVLGLILFSIFLYLYFL